MCSVVAMDSATTPVLAGSTSVPLCFPLFVCLVLLDALCLCCLCAVLSRWILQRLQYWPAARQYPSVFPSSFVLSCLMLCVCVVCMQCCRDGFCNDSSIGRQHVSTPLFSPPCLSCLA